LTTDIYLVPRSVQEAVEILGGSSAYVLAGGQTLIPRMKAGDIPPAVFVDIARVTGLPQVELTRGTATIGAMVRQRQIEDGEALAEALPILREAAAVVADPAVRSQGTLVGALAAADPGGDWPAVALALDGVVFAQSLDSERGIPVVDLFLDPYVTTLDPGELVTHVELRIPEKPAGMTYLKLRHPASGFALVGMAAILRLDSSGRCVHCRIAVTGAGPRTTRLQAVEDVITGREPEPALLAQAASRATHGLTLSSDLHADESYRAELVTVYVRRALSLAATRAEQSLTSA
jgi:carbon-monoxide dehydrogenase medium subunit